MKKILAVILIGILNSSIMFVVYLKGYSDGRKAIIELQAEKMCKEAKFQQFKDIPKECYKYLELKEKE